MFGSKTMNYVKLESHRIPSHQKSLHHFVGNFHAYLHTNNQLHHSLKILQRNNKLVNLGNLGMPGHTHQKRWYQLVENLEVYLNVKNKLHVIHFFLELLLFKESCNLIGQQHFGP